MCCGCGAAYPGQCLRPDYDQCDWEFGCVSESGDCGCAASICKPYDSLPCHNDFNSYTCTPYANTTFAACGYGDGGDDDDDNDNKE